MNVMRKGYEERYLITVLSSVMNQRSTPEPMRQLNWEKMFHLADFHHVAHLLHYGIMGLEEEIPQLVRRRFFEKYLEAVYRTERLRKAEKQIRPLMERDKINCFFLNYSETVKCYPIEEMCCRESIEIGSDKKSTGLIANLLRIRDFVERPTEEQGNLYYQIPGVKVFFYNFNIFLSRPMRKYFKDLLKELPTRKGFDYIKEIQPDDQYLFLMCRLTDSYAKGEISLNQIIDFWIFYKKNAENFSWKYIYEKLKKLKIEEFAEKLECLVLRWFGTGAGIENVEVYDAMESYILSKGVEGRDISAQFLPLIKTVADCYARNRRAEQFSKLLEWTFPDRGYMETIYPMVEKAPISLPVFWIVRLGRYALRICYSKIEEKVVLKLVNGVKHLKLLNLFINSNTIHLGDIEADAQEGEQLEAENENDSNLVEAAHEVDKETAEIPK